MEGTGTLWNLVGPLLAALPRVVAAVTVAPLFPASLFPTLLRGSVAVSLSLYLYPYLAAHLPPILTPLEWVVFIAKESLIGGLLGLATGTLVWAFESLGAAVDFQVGFSNALLFDPFGGHDAGPISRLMGQLGIVLFVAGGGLQVFAALLIESFRLWPVAAFHPSIGAPLADYATHSLGALLQLIVRLAVPVVLLLALVDVAFGLLNRVVPQLNVFYFTMPLKGVLAAVMMALYLTFLADIAMGQLKDLQSWLERLNPVIGGH